MNKDIYVYMKVIYCMFAFSPQNILYEMTGFKVNQGQWSYPSFDQVLTQFTSIYMVILQDWRSSDLMIHVLRKLRQTASQLHTCAASVRFRKCKQTSLYVTLPCNVSQIITYNTIWISDFLQFQKRHYNRQTTSI